MKTKSQEDRQTDVYETRIREIVTRNTVTLDANDNVHDALQLMGDNRVSTLPVVDGKNRCVGILSASDLVDFTRDTDDDLRSIEMVNLETQKFMVDKLVQSLGDEKVETYMSESVVTVDLETRVGKAAQIMLRNRIHHLPVVDHHEKLVGIVSTMDILGEFASAAPDS